MVEDGLANLDEETAMPARGHSFDGQGTIDPAAAVNRVNAREEDAFWRRAFWRERYYSAGLDYEDYAPAYCVGYVGYAQYGGGYDDAERSLCANWERIKGDSRLSMDEAKLAMRAAWDRMAGRLHVARHAFGIRPPQERLRRPFFKLRPAFLQEARTGDRAGRIGRD
jgi:hypothetical protein